VNGEWKEEPDPAGEVELACLLWMYAAAERDEYPEAQRDWRWHRTAQDGPACRTL